MKSTKPELPKKPVLPELPTKATCRACGQPRDFEVFRVYKVEYPQPDERVVTRMDFCHPCEQQHGTITLYRRYNAYGTPAIIEAVFAAHRTPPVHRSTEQVRLLVEPAPERVPETKEEVVQQEIQRRELCKRRLLFYVKQMMPEYTPGWVHQDICRRLEKFMKDVEAGKAPRLMLAVPPRHGKSQLASDMFPSWVLGHHPDWPIIIASYAQTLPLEFSREIRDRVGTPEYQAIFPETKLRQDAKGVEAWKTTKKGGIKAIGVGGGLTGFGGRILIADDMIKDAEEANSEVIRENAWNWYKLVFRSRCAPGGGILLIGTRWHWHDPMGRALEADFEAMKQGVPEYDRENWQLISYPAIAENDEYLMPDGTIERDLPDPESALRTLRRKGDALHPERWPLNELRKIKSNYTTSDWSALFQQNPTPEEGDFFKKREFQYQWLDPVYRPLCRIFMTVDYAIGKKQRNDFTVMGVFALDHADNLYELEIRRGRMKTYDIAENIVALVEKYKPEVYAGEQGAIHHAVWPVVEKALKEKRLYVSVDETLVPIQDKETRARPLQGRMQRGKFYMSYDEASKPEVLDVAEREMLQFPNGANDDCVDMRAWAARLALNLALPQMRAPPKRESFQDKLNAMVSGGNHDFMAA